MYQRGSCGKKERLDVRIFSGRYMRKIGFALLGMEGKTLARTELQIN